MAKKGKKGGEKAPKKENKSIESMIEDQLLTSFVKRELDFDDIHRKVSMFSKKYQFNQSMVAKVVQRIINEAFSTHDFSLNPPPYHHHHGHGGH